MARIFPFKGIIYNKKKLANLSKVMAPPYDVISPELQEKLYARNDFNFIRLILGKEFASDTIYNNRYVRAAAFLQGWLRHKIMFKDDQPNIYAYEQKFKAQGKTYARLGFISLLRLEEFGRGKVFPHEFTYPKAKLDRLQLMRASNANFESIFSLYSDKKEKITKTLKAFTKRKPIVEVKDDKGRSGDRSPALAGRPAGRDREDRSGDERQSGLHCRRASSLRSGHPFPG